MCKEKETNEIKVKQAEFVVRYIDGGERVIVEKFKNVLTAKQLERLGVWDSYSQDVWFWRVDENVIAIDTTNYTLYLRKKRVMSRAEWDAIFILLRYAGERLHKLLTDEKPHIVKI